MMRPGHSCKLSVTILGFVLVRTSVHGFVPYPTRAMSRSLTTYPQPLHSKLFGPEDNFDDDIGNIGQPPTDGDDGLAQDFFKELRKREETAQPMETSYGLEDEIIARIYNPKEESMISRVPTVDRNDAVSSPTPKFTGQERLYAQSPSSPGTGLPRRTPREIMMEREYQLVGRAERGIVVQAIVAVIALVFYAYVGLSGGIVSGPDAGIQDFGGDDEIPFEQLMPVQRDREVSIWL